MRNAGHALLLASLALWVCACTNNPYRPGETGSNTYFSDIGTPPTNLDPAHSYYSHEAGLMDQIYEPPFGYHYLKRPYELVPLTAREIPSPLYFDRKGRRLADPDPPVTLVGRAEYTIRIRPGIRYQNHPCFARAVDGRMLHRNLEDADFKHIKNPNDFAKQGTRELLARDFELQARRLADPRLQSPVFSTLARYVLGLDGLYKAFTAMLERERLRRKRLAGPGYNQEMDEKENPIELAYMKPPFAGVQTIDDTTYKVVLKRKYPQILYWMCMHFFAPVPQEALDFYAQAALRKRQISIQRWPVGTGPYYLARFKSNEVIMLQRNPNYREDLYPSQGSPGDSAAGLLRDAGRPLPFIDRQVWRLEKESIPRWNKFLQGYYDASGIGGDVFDQAIQMQTAGSPTVSEAMAKRDIDLITSVATSVMYMAFNMLDDVVGGYEPEKRKLRQAISIVLDYNEYLDIFANGRGILAQGPIPPGIFGYREGREGTNPFVDRWDPVRKRHVRKSLDAAKQLMREAGYPDGRGSDGRQLTLHYDHSASGHSHFRTVFDWISGRFASIGIRLKDRGTELSRFRKKQIDGNWQISTSGWLADYPDPENFLFLFYGPNGKVKFDGSNGSNYSNPEFNELFVKMESMENSPARQDVINRMMEILQGDAPAVWLYHPVGYSLHHAWYHNIKPHHVSNNVRKHFRLDPNLRVSRQKEWNRPVLWPIVLLLGILLAGTIPAAVIIYRRERGI